MSYANLLEKPLHSLTSNDVRHLGVIADDIFEPLTRPFRQHRLEPHFDFRKTIRGSSRHGGDFLPEYTDHVREHRKSRLVIAMSLSGIDRCAAVGLIPLFKELQRHLNFRLFIYTDDLIEAKFTHDGFFENDIDIAWNNVAAPIVMRRLNQIAFEKQEDTLLFIDNLGGGDSKWYDYWSSGEIQALRAEQAEYLKSTGHSYWVKLRRELNGDYEKIHTSSYANSLKTWQTIVERNTKERWVDAPAMMDYLVRWLFHPEFGRKQHGTSDFRENYGIEYQDHLKTLKSKFRSIHWLRTINAPISSRWSGIARLNVVDYLHEIDSIEGFAHVLANIVHNRCTNRLTHNPVVFADVISTLEEEVGEEGTDEVDHEETIVGKESCFSRIQTEEIGNTLPAKLQYEYEQYDKATNSVMTKTIPWKSLDISEWFPSGLEKLSDDHWGTMMSYTPNVDIKPFMSQYSMEESAKKFLKFIRENRFYCQRDSVYVGDRKNKLTESPNYHLTQPVAKDVQDYLDLWSEDYAPYTQHLPLKNIVWCTGGLYQSKLLTYSVTYTEDKEERRKTVFHEHGHHFEHIVPEIGIFTNHLLERKTGGVLKDKLVAVYGGKAMPVTDGSAPWISSYAGKWYTRPHENLPVHTEIVSVYSEYFTSPEKLVKLMKHDPYMTKFMAFIFMGGPLAVVQHMKNIKAKDALETMQQKNMKQNGVTTRRKTSSGGGYGRGRRSSSSSGGYVAKKNTRNSFGV